MPLGPASNRSRRKPCHSTGLRGLHEAGPRIVNPRPRAYTTAGRSLGSGIPMPPFLVRRQMVGPTGAGRMPRRIMLS